MADDDLPPVQDRLQALGAHTLGDDPPPEAVEAVLRRWAETLDGADPLRVKLERDALAGLDAMSAGAVDAALKASSDSRPEEPPSDDAEPDPDEVREWWERGREVLMAVNQLVPFRAELDRVGYAGDPTPLELVHTALHSRKLPRPIGLALKGPSAAGKSYTVEIARHFHPDDAVLKLDASSARYLAYMTHPTAHRYVFIAEGDAFHSEGIGATIIRSLAWGDGIRYGTVVNADHGPEAVEIMKPGPTGLITTSTHDLQEEIETRLISLPITDDPDQTAAIVRELAREAEGHRPADPDLGNWVAASRLLSAVGEKQVVVPFASRLAERVPAKDVRMRRDFKQLLSFIQAIAFMQQFRRERDAEGRILANGWDYVDARRLMARVLQVTQSAVTDEVRETVDMVATLTGPDGTHPHGVSYTDLGDALGLTRQGAEYRCRKPLNRGWLINTEERSGYPARLRIGDPLPDDVAVLPPREDVFGGGPLPDPPKNPLARLQHPENSPQPRGREPASEPESEGEGASHGPLAGGGSLAGPLAGGSSRSDGENPGSRKRASDSPGGGLNT